ncbi:MAG TPA: TetR/AcrR family transcriptional regulator [Candidatus Cybelea sp.]|nr:TetR/AcrR family transcriptional regulator [Candidatus Cybelea sp.]
MARAATIRTAQGEGPARARQPALDRRKALIEAARSVFLERGYANASIDAVVELAGGSKATVYQLFGNKEGLLAAIVEEGAEELALLVNSLPLDGSPEESLRTYARNYLGMVLRPERLAMFRLVVGEASRSPEIGDVFYRSGPRRCGHWLADFIRGMMVRGQIRAADPERTAFSFIHALRGDLYMQVLLNPTRAPTQAEIDAHIDFVIRNFLEGYRAAGTDAPDGATIG